MIKTYRYNANRNTVSHILQGKNGVTVRYNFERGNVITKQKPEIILKTSMLRICLKTANFSNKVWLHWLAPSPSNPMLSSQNQ